MYSLGYVTSRVSYHLKANVANRVNLGEAQTSMENVCPLSSDRIVSCFDSNLMHTPHPCPSTWSVSTRKKAAAKQKQDAQSIFLFNLIMLHYQASQSSYI